MARAEATPAVAPSAPEPSTADKVTLPAGYAHTRSLQLHPRVVPWIAPLAVLIIFLLLFFPWVGMYPSGRGVYSQTGWGSPFNAYWCDPVWEDKAQPATAFNSRQNEPGVNVLLIFFLLVYLVGMLPLALLSLLVGRVNLKLPPAVEKVLPWRHALFAAVLALGTLFLFFQICVGFSLKRTVRDLVDQRFQAEQEKARTPEAEKVVTLKKEQALAEFNVRTTFWFRLVFLLNLLALAGVGLEHWFARRGQKPPPRIDFSW